MNKVEFKIKAVSRVKSNIIIRKDTIYKALTVIKAAKHTFIFKTKSVRVLGVLD